jgi:hypothetical protein
LRVIHRLLGSTVVLALAVSACAYESSGTTTTTTIDPDHLAPSTGPADIVFREQRIHGSGVEVESVSLPSPGFIVLYSDEGGAPGAVIGATDVLSPGVIASVPVSFFVPLEADSVVHAQVHIDMDRDEAFTYEPPDAFIDVPATFANGEVASVPALIGLLPPVAPAVLGFSEQRITGDAITISSVDLPAAGFVVLREDDLGRPGRFLGVSDLLPAGVTTDLEVAFDEPIGISAVVFASLYVDRDEDGVLSLGDDAVDRLAQGEDGLEATLGMPITVVPLTPVRLAADDQETEGLEVSVTATVPAQAFAVLRADASGEPGEVLGVSDLLMIGTNGITFGLDPPLAADATLWVIVHIDLDGNGRFDGGEPVGILEGGGAAEASFRVILPEEEEEEPADS